MPPPEAVEAGKVQPLTDEDRRTIFRWIDLGCPIDLEYDPDRPEYNGPGSGWMDDETRPALAVTQPLAGRNDRLERILIGAADAYTGIDAGSLTVTADFEIDGIAAGANLAERFQPLPEGRWQWNLTQPITELDRATLTVSIRDRQGNVTRLERRFSVEASESK
jgi:hypothetical protein